VKTILYHIYL